MHFKNIGPYISISYLGMTVWGSKSIGDFLGGICLGQDTELELKYCVLSAAS